MIKLPKLKTKCQTSALMHNEYQYCLSCFSLAIKLTWINLDCMHNLCNLCIKHVLLFKRYLHIDKIIKFSIKTITYMYQVPYCNIRNHAKISYNFEKMIFFSSK